MSERLNIPEILANYEHENRMFLPTEEATLEIHMKQDGSWEYAEAYGLPSDSFEEVPDSYGLSPEQVLLRVLHHYFAATVAKYSAEVAAMSHDCATFEKIRALINPEAAVSSIEDYQNDPHEFDDLLNTKV